MSQFGFKTSFFGFNKEEVNAYIAHIMAEHKGKVKLLEGEKADLENKIQKLTEELNEMKQKVDYYTAKEAEIEKMSISIGTMYMLAKQNAREIVSDAENCAKEITDHAKNQLLAATKADQTLSSLKEELIGAAESFSSKVSAMSDSFEEIKANLENELKKLDSKPDIELFIENL